LEFIRVKIDSDRKSNFGFVFDVEDGNIERCHVIIDSARVKGFLVIRNSDPYSLVVFGLVDEDGVVEVLRLGGFFGGRGIDFVEERKLHERGQSSKGNKI
jgi:hypothetical protein